VSIHRKPSTAAKAAISELDRLNELIARRPLEFR